MALNNGGQYGIDDVVGGILNKKNYLKPQTYDMWGDFSKINNGNTVSQTGMYNPTNPTYNDSNIARPNTKATTYSLDDNFYTPPENRYENVWANAGSANNQGFAPMPTNNKPGDPVQMMPTKQTTQQGSQDVLLGAQNRVMQGIPNTTLNMTSQATQNLLNDPNMGYNPQQYMQGALEGFDYNRANALEAARQGMADTMNAGQTRGDLVQLALQGARDRSGFQNQLEQEEAARNRQAVLDSIAEGRQTAEQERSGYATDIDSLVKVRGAGEPELGRDWQGSENVKDRTFEMDLNERVLSQDTWKTQRAQELEAMGINSREAIAMAGIESDVFQTEFSGNLQRYLQSNMNYNDAQKLAAEQAFLASEANYSRQVELLKQTGNLNADSIERVKDRVYDATMQYLDNEFALKGISLAAVINNMQDMDPAVAKSFLENLAEENGITIPTLSDDEKDAATTRVNQDAAEEVLSGVSEPPRSKDDASYNGLLELESTPKVSKDDWGPKTTHNPKGAGNDWKGYVNFDNAIDNNNGYISVGGELYRVSRGRINRAGVDGMKYTFVDVVTGEKLIKKT